MPNTTEDSTFLIRHERARDAVRALHGVQAVIGSYADTENAIDRLVPLAERDAFIARTEFIFADVLRIVPLETTTCPTAPEDLRAWDVEVIRVPDEPYANVHVKVPALGDVRWIQNHMYAQGIIDQYQYMSESDPGAPLVECVHPHGTITVFVGYRDERITGRY